ncbi:MAG: urease accessory protein UreF [bacterium]|nr:urease accessory protein UreF [bacterium]
MNHKNKFYLLQVNDALFPIGGYSHSYGLETYIQKNIVKDAADAKDYLTAKLKYNTLYTDLFAVRLAYEYAKNSDLGKLLELNQLTEVSKTPLEIRDASKKMASRFLKTVQELDIPYETNIFQEYVTKLGVKGLHHACIYGVFCAAIGIEERDALSHYLYAQTSAIVTTSVKSIPLSQTDGQKILTSSFPLLTSLVELVQGLEECMYGLSAPAFDIRCMQHESLYSRIYMS